MTYHVHWNFTKSVLEVAMHFLPCDALCVVTTQEVKEFKMEVADAGVTEKPDVHFVR